MELVKWCKVCDSELRADSMEAFARLLTQHDHEPRGDAELGDMARIRARIRIAADIWRLESGRLDLAVTQDGELIEAEELR